MVEVKLGVLGQRYVLYQNHSQIFTDTGMFAFSVSSLLQTSVKAEIISLLNLLLSAC